MIYTVTFNPSLDYVMQCEKLSLGHVNRSLKEIIYPGGKGINVSIVLSHLGIPNKALGFIAGFTGKEIDALLKDLSITTDFILLSQGLSRINVKLSCEDETEVNATGPNITLPDLNHLQTQLDLLEPGDFLVLAGSIPLGIPSTIYQDIMVQLKDKKIHIIVDATKDLLLNVLPYHPFLVKPNHLELAELFGVTLSSTEEIITYAQKLQDKGAQNVLVSMGAQGSLLITQEGTVERMNAPKGTVINTVGAGDSMIAGFIAGYLRTQDFKEALKFATATGSATAFSDWLATPPMIEALLKQL